MAKYTIEADFQNLFRPLTDEELAVAKENNLADPQHERIPPIVLWDGVVVDGHHTLKIRQNLRINGKPPKIRFVDMEFADRADAMAYAVRAQLGRRNLSPSQVAIALAKLPKAQAGRRSVADATLISANLHELSRNAIAEQHGVSPRTVKTADRVREHGAKAVVDAVTEGTVSVSDAAAVVELPKREQQAALSKVKSGEAKTLKAAANGKPKRKRTSGKATFDYKRWQQTYGTLVRLTDAHHKAHPDAKARDTCLDSLNTYYSDFQGWRRKTNA